MDPISGLTLIFSREFFLRRGELGVVLAERNWGRPLEPDPDNTGGGTKMSEVNGKRVLDSLSGDIEHSSLPVLVIQAHKMVEDIENSG